MTINQILISCSAAALLGGWMLQARVLASTLPDLGPSPRTALPGVSASAEARNASQREVDLVGTGNGTSAVAPRIVAITAVFGEEAARKRYLRVFVESARSSGVDVAILGSPPVPFELPPNVRHVNVTWRDLVRRVSDRVFDGRWASGLAAAKPFKIIDLKPLYAHLFPEVVEGYEWWGHIDNDMLLGDVRRFLTPEFLAEKDIVSGTVPDDRHGFKTWGPLTLFRNVKTVNELFNLTERPEIFNMSQFRGFDEWFFRHGMSSIINRHAAALGLQLHGGLPGVWDGCNGMEPVGNLEEDVCTECRLSMPPHGGSRQILRSYHGGIEVLYCHHQYAKRKMVASLQNKTLEEHLLRSGRLRVTKKDGFMTFPGHMENETSGNCILPAECISERMTKVAPQYNQSMPFYCDELC